MADGEYRRLTCKVDACDGNHKAHGYCIRHYRQWQRGGVKQDAARCAHCEEPFQPPHVGTIYCSKRCKLAAWKAENPERFKALPSNQRKVSAIYAGYCQQCGGAFVARRERRYCGAACEPKRLRPSRLGVDYIPPVRICPCCGLQWSAIRLVGSSPYCQTPYCQHQRARLIRDQRRRRKDGGSNVQRAKRAGVPYRYFDETRVLDRDGWTCQLCGVRMPRAARGSTKPNAPEFDHCIPLALGGPHTPENGQCLCRTCNGLKADRWCERSAARAAARGVLVPARPNGRAQKASFQRTPQTMGEAVIDAPASPDRAGRPAKAIGG